MNGDKEYNMETNIDCKQECGLTHNQNGKCDGNCPSEILRQILEQLELQTTNNN